MRLERQEIPPSQKKRCLIKSEQEEEKEKRKKQVRMGLTLRETNCNDCQS